MLHVTCCNSVCITVGVHAAVSAGWAEGKSPRQCPTLLFGLIIPHFESGSCCCCVRLLCRQLYGGCRQLGLVLISLAELEHFLRVSCSEMMDADTVTIAQLLTGLREI